ncbi:MAG TPA: cytochrome c-type biogenesis protein [Arenimonas sp.]|nr:cytochrome c-type biogenesis protein [Arenimonas sp.]
MKSLWLVFTLLFGILFAEAAISLEPTEYQSAAEEQRFKSLANELRCVMCQNQSIADSNAPIAHDLRVEVLSLMREGKTDAEIKNYLVERYSEFVLYQPPVNKKNALLWAGPFLLLLIGLFVVIGIIRKKSVAETTADQNEEW